MAIATVFTPKSMSATQYDEIIRRLEQAGAGKPKGRAYHVCYGSGDKLNVLDVWESKELFDAFGKALIPVLQQVGVDPGTPAVTEVHNIIVG